MIVVVFAALQSFYFFIAVVLLSFFFFNVKQKLECNSHKEEQLPSSHNYLNNENDCQLVCTYFFVAFPFFS